MNKSLYQGLIKSKESLVLSKINKMSIKMKSINWRDPSKKFVLLFDNMKRN